MMLNTLIYSHLKILFTLGTQQKKKEFNIVKPNILQSHNVIVLLPVFMLQNGVNTKNQDDCWMNMAIKLASNGIGLTSPNPCVGAVIVHENQVIGSGFHKKPACLMRKERLLPTEWRMAMPPCSRTQLCMLLWNHAVLPGKHRLVRMPF